MNARFAEPVRQQHLALTDAEAVISDRADKDGRTAKQLLLDCEKDIYIGFLFVGTNNNKYRDTPGNSSRQQWRSARR